MLKVLHLKAANLATDPPFECPGPCRGQEGEKAFYQSERPCSFIFLVWPSGGLISCFLHARCNGLGLAVVPGWRVALAGGQITGSGCYHGLWNMELRALHVLAQGAGTSDVVGDMWKLSSIYPAQPSLVATEQRGLTAVHHCSQTYIQAKTHNDAFCEYLSTLL